MYLHRCDALCLRVVQRGRGYKTTRRQRRQSRFIERFSHSNFEHTADDSQILVSGMRVRRHFVSIGETQAHSEWLALARIALNDGHFRTVLEYGGRWTPYDARQRCVVARRRDRTRDIGVAAAGCCDG